MLGLNPQSRIPDGLSLFDDLIGAGEDRLRDV
jgi:hypothetical protein